VTITDKPPVVETTPAIPQQRTWESPRLVGGGVLVLIGLLWLLERAGVIDVSVTAVLALATMVVGVSLMVLSSKGTHAGLIVFGTILALITLSTAAAPLEGFQGGVGDRTIVVTTADDIRSDYELSVGSLVVDLSDVQDLNEMTSLNASIGVGELLIRVPAGTEVRVDGTVAAGELTMFDRSYDGAGIFESYESPGFAEANVGLDITVEAFMGTVEVTDE
jgi:predicted membrane protein